MFYSENILTHKGPLANIWLAAHWDRRLTKNQIVQTNIESSVRDIVNGVLPPMALRLSGQLLLGVSKIYGRKTRYLYEDCQEALTRLKTSFKQSNVDLPASSSKASHHSITMPTVSNLEDALAPEPELDLNALLRDAATYTPLKTPQLPRRASNMEYELGRNDVGLPPLPEGDLLPSEFQMDVEVARRATLSAAHSDIIESIEAARKDDSRPSLPFSPLRTPTKLNSNFEEAPINDDYGYFDEPVIPEEEVNVMNQTIKIQPTIVPQTSNNRKGKQRRKLLVLDNETEMPNSMLQEQVRDTRSILIPKSTSLDIVLNETLRLLTLTIPHTTESNRRSKPMNKPIMMDEQQPAAYEEAPINDDYYGMDYDDVPVAPPSPKSPRISKIQNDENQVPTINQLQLPGSPFKSSNNSTTDDGSLKYWQQSFSSVNRILELDSLIEQPGRKKQAAEAFLQVLVFATKNLVSIEQLVPYGVIKVKPTVNLFTASV